MKSYNRLIKSYNRLKTQDPLRLTDDLRFERKESILTLSEKKYEGMFTCGFLEEYYRHGEVGVFEQDVYVTFPIKGKMVFDEQKYYFPFLELDFNYELVKDKDDWYFRFKKIFGKGKIFLIDDKTFIGLGEELQIENRFDGSKHNKYKFGFDSSIEFSPDKKTIEIIENVRRKTESDYVFKKPKVYEDVNMDVIIGKVISRNNSEIDKISLQFVYDNNDRLEYIYQTLKNIKSFKKDEIF